MLANMQKVIALAYVQLVILSYYRFSSAAIALRQ
jgi:hypothetical protein